MSELIVLKGPAVAILFSASFQAFYHLYQGIVPTIAYFALFLLFSFYFAEKRRVVPVVLAHAYMDLIPLAISAWNI